MIDEIEARLTLSDKIHAASEGWSEDRLHALAEVLERLARGSCAEAVGRELFTKDSRSREGQSQQFQAGCRQWQTGGGGVRG